MADISFMGRTYKTDDLKREAISLAAQLAKNARLLDPLPTDTDLSEAEQNEIQAQILTMTILPPIVADSFWSAFAAHHLGQLVSSLRTLSLATQHTAVSTLIQILSLFRQPKVQPYFRKFLQDSTLSQGLPTLIADSFVRGIAWKRPSGPGYICCLISNLIFWCDMAQGDDSKASIDATVRRDLSRKLDLLQNAEGFQAFERFQQMEIQRLSQLLYHIDRVSDLSYVSGIQQHLHAQLEACQNPNCAELAEMTCSRCKSVRYCGRRCQSLDWKNAHKMRCFQAAF